MPATEIAQLLIGAAIMVAVIVAVFEMAAQ